MLELPTVDLRDVFYGAFGLALLGLTLQPALDKYRVANFPLIYILSGAGLGWLGLPLVDPRDGGLSSVVVEHVSELIVIISLAGAGLAIDTRMTWSNWQSAFRLLGITMPLTLLAVTLMGLWLGMGVAGAILVAAALAPTDPVLARTVQVSPPGRDEGPMEVALTAEAGLNDGLAFPFVYLAISAAMFGWAQPLPGWLWDWFTFDLLYRVSAGILAGFIVGWAVTKVAFSGLGDARNGAWNSIVMVLAATLISYGFAEAVDGYGFLAVFVTARAGRMLNRYEGPQGYERFVHHGADQLESILLALLLLWFGMFVGGGGLAGTRWQEVAFAVALIFVVRPLTGRIGLTRMDCPNDEAWKVSFFGVRGMGSIFYIAYAQNHAEFVDIEMVWRVAALVIALSILVHGFASKVAFDEKDEGGDVELHPYAEYEQNRQAEG